MSAAPAPPRRGDWLAVAAAWALRALGATWRVQVVGRDPLRDRRPQATAPVGALWHRDLVCAAWYFRDRGVRVGVSLSRDGERIARALERLGHAPAARGSSSRSGARALRELIRSARAGTPVALLADGPRGPARIAKPGVVLLGRATRGAVIPVAFASRPALRARSWDRTVVPWPFARVVCAFGDPVEVSRRGLREPPEADRRRIEAALEALTERAAAALSESRGPAPAPDS
jgi:lysophospholipid acyltransferase (LPLAT)-like uncharacterized protein